MKGWHNAWPEEECIPVVLPAAFQEHLFCSPPRTLHLALCAPRSASSWGPLRPLQTAGRLQEPAAASQPSSCIAPGALCNWPGQHPVWIEQTPFRPLSWQSWASDPDWQPATGLYCDSLSPPLRPDHRGVWDKPKTHDTNRKHTPNKNKQKFNKKNRIWNNECTRTMRGT